MSDGRLAGIGVGDCTTGEHRPLAHAVSDVEELKGLLSRFDGKVLRNPTESEVRDHLGSLDGSLPEGGPLVVVWSGHGFTDPAGRLRLPAADSGARPFDGLGLDEVVGRCALSGANQLLFVFDTCFSGTAIPSSDLVMETIRASQDPRQVWVGVITSCLSLETARDGLFGERLRRILRDGPDLPELRVRWSVHNKHVRGDDVCDAVLKEWDSAAQSPDFQSRGNAWWMFPNPLYRPGAPEQVVEHLLRAARSGAPLSERSWFTGRTAQVNQVVGWVREGRPGLRVVTGSAGTGKSSIVGRVVSLSNPEERERLLADGHAWSHELPELRSVSAHVHARRLTADLAADVLAGQLVRGGLLAPREARRNASELVGEVQRAVEEGARPPVLVVDGLDEARGEAFTMADDLLTRLARHATVIVSTREMQRGDGQLPLVATLAPEGVGIDLDEDVVQREGRGDLAEYVRLRLGGVDARMNAGAIAEHLFGQTAQQTFLLARLVSDQLVAAPVDTSAEGWTEQVSHTVEEALDTDLAAVTPPPGPHALPPVALARTILRALTWGYGAGFPEAEWLTVANAEAPEGVEVAREDIGWVLDQLGRHVVQDGEEGVAVYRLAHQSLADHLRPPYRGSAEEPFHPEASVVAEALVGRYRALLGTGIPAEEPRYLWLYAWRHAAEAGVRGIELMRSLGEENADALLPDLGAVDMLVADRFQHWGRWADAVPPAEEAVQVYRAVSAAEAAFVPELANALNSLGDHYGDLGRDQEALLVTEEALALHRMLVQDNPAHLPSLGDTLNNLGNHHSNLGHHHEALAVTEESLRLYRRLAQNDPTEFPSLATALNNLSTRYSNLGRDLEGLSAAEEALGLRRSLAGSSPAHLPSLANALDNLGNRYGRLGRYDEALPLAEEAVRLHRSLMDRNPGGVPHLAMALNNLGAHYRYLGRLHEAVTVAQEALGLFRALAQSNPAHLPNLATTLSNLGSHYSDLGRPHQALPPTEESVRLRRALAESNPAHLPGLADALNNIGSHYRDLGRHDEALPVVEEALRLYRTVAGSNPAYLPRLVTALTNVGLVYGKLGRHDEALPPTQAAVELARTLAEDNAAHLSDLADVLNNIGNHYRNLGRDQEALSVTQESVHLRRTLARNNPAHIPGLANTLGNLANHYRGLGSAKALPPAEESVRLARALADEDPAHLPGLADALNNLSCQYGSLGRHAEALPPAQESVRLRRALAEEDPAHRSDLADALYNLGCCYDALGRHAEAVPPTRESVDLSRTLTAGSPAHLADLANALNSLSRHCGKLGRPTDGIWTDVLGDSPPEHAAYLLLKRSLAAPAGQPDAVEWLVTCDSLRSALAEDWMIGALRTEARRHRAPDATAFDDAWKRLTGAALPDWFAIDTELLAQVRSWISTDTYEEERDHLAAHPGILAPEADAAVEEALLGTIDEEAQRYRALRREARTDGVEAAYRPLLHTQLLHKFANADPATQRGLLSERRDDLLGDFVFNALSALVTAADGESPPLAYERAKALLHLASIDAHEPVLSALTDWTRFPPLLSTLARKPDTAALANTAFLAFLAATDTDQAATAQFHGAVAAALYDDHQAAEGHLVSAHAKAPESAPTWMADLADIARHHPSVLPLIPRLTTLMTTPKDEHNAPD